VDRRARGDPLDVNEVECLIVRRIAVKMKERQRCGPVLANHGVSIGRSRARRSQITIWPPGFAQRMMISQQIIGKHPKKNAHHVGLAAGP
jgi:hypothetical protein